MVRWVGWGQFGATLLVACTSGCGAAQRSSGEIGCDPSEISITNHSMGPFSESWTATCRGRKYICSGAGKEVSCHPARDGLDDMVDSSGSFEDSASPTESEIVADSPTSAPPDGAAGFSFSMNAEQAEEACVAGGGQYQPDAHGGGCSRAPKRVGFPAAVALKLCSQVLCSIRLEQSVDDAGANSLKDTFVRLVKALRGKYGKPTEVRARVAGLCGQQLASCLRSRQAELHARWEWPSRHGIDVEVLGADSGATLVLEYQSPSEGDGAMDGL